MSHWWQGLSAQPLGTRPVSDTNTNVDHWTAGPHFWSSALTKGMHLLQHLHPDFPDLAERSHPEHAPTIVPVYCPRIQSDFLPFCIARYFEVGIERRMDISELNKWLHQEIVQSFWLVQMLLSQPASRPFSGILSFGTTDMHFSAKCGRK